MDLSVAKTEANLMLACSAIMKKLNASCFSCVATCSTSFHTGQSKKISSCKGRMLGECQSSFDLKKTVISRKVTFLEKVNIDSADVRVGIIVHSNDSFSSYSKFEFNFLSNVNDDHMKYLADISPIVSYLGEFVHQAMENLLKLNNIHLESSMLSVREKECLCWAADGKTASEIASRLFITESTVKFHFRKIMKKLEARNTTHAITIAMLGGVYKPSLP